jgi:hypothetical protein
MTEQKIIRNEWDKTGNATMYTEANAHAVPGWQKGIRSRYANIGQPAVADEVDDVDNFRTRFREGLAKIAADPGAAKDIVSAEEVITLPEPVGAVEKA